MTTRVINNVFSLDTYRNIIQEATHNGYVIQTVQQFIDDGCKSEDSLVLRHDLDTKPRTLFNMLNVELECGVRSTIYARVTANEYNLLGYTVLPKLLAAQEEGFEIGLHTNFLEYAEINGHDPLYILELENSIMRSFFNVTGIAPHRDFNYLHNSLPFIENNWDRFKKLGYKYQAYDDRIMNNTVYVNENFSPHLCWARCPFEAIAEHKSVYLSTHPHWWYDKHPFEEQ